MDRRLRLPDRFHRVTNAVQKMRFGDQGPWCQRRLCRQQVWCCFDAENASGKGCIDADRSGAITVAEALIATANGTGQVRFDRGGCGNHAVGGFLFPSLQPPVARDRVVVLGDLAILLLLILEPEVARLMHCSIV